MNTIKLYRRNGDGDVLVHKIKVTQSTKRVNKRTVPYASEVYEWAKKNGWSRTVPRLPSSP